MIVNSSEFQSSILLHRLGAFFEQPFIASTALRDV